MKSLKNIVVIMLCVFGMCQGLQAQAPYKHSIGVTVGNFEALSYKTFLANHLALQLDLGYKYTYAADRYGSFYVPTVELNPNLMYEGHFTKGLYGFLGGGVSLGYSWITAHAYYVHFHSDYGKFGVNGILGLEYKFNIPLTLQLDFRPGYGMLFDNDVRANYFDWSANLGVRYTF